MSLAIEILGLLEKRWHGDGGAVVESFSRVVSDVAAGKIISGHALNITLADFLLQLYKKTGTMITKRLNK